jgi:hypothetical protein
MSTLTSPREPKSLQGPKSRPRTTIANGPRRSRCLAFRASPITEAHAADEPVQREPGEPHFGKDRSPPQEFWLQAPDSYSMWPLSLRQSSTWVGGCLIILLPVTMMLLAIKLGSPSLSDSQAGDRTVGSAWSSSPVSTDPATQPSKPEPRLIVHETRGIAGEPVPLGLTMQGHADGAVVIITGLIPGMSLSTGSATGPDTWQMAATGLPDTWVGPPKGFVGAVGLAAELHLDGAVLQRLPIRIEWIATSPAAAAQVPTTPSLGEAVATPQQFDRDEIAIQINKTAEHHGARTHQKRGARKVTVSIPRKGPAKASIRRNKPVYALPTQLTRASWPGW